MFNKLLDSGTIKYVKNANYKMVLEADVLAYKDALESKPEIFSEYITISDAARTLEIGRNSLYTLMRNNEIPYDIINGKNRLKTVDVINYKNKSKEVHIRHSANILGISLKKLHQMIKEGVFSYRLVNRYKFLQLEDILNYQKQLTENKAHLITVKKTADLLQCSPKKIYSMLNKNRLSYKKIGIYKLIPKEEVLNLIMKNKF